MEKEDQKKMSRQLFLFLNLYLSSILFMFCCLLIKSPWLWVLQLVTDYVFPYANITRFSENHTLGLVSLLRSQALWFWFRSSLSFLCWVCMFLCLGFPRESCSFLQPTHTWANKWFDIGELGRELATWPGVCYLHPKTAEIGHESQSGWIVRIIEI